MFQSLGRDSGRSDAGGGWVAALADEFQSLGRDSGRSDFHDRRRLPVGGQGFNRSVAIRVGLTTLPYLKCLHRKMFQSLGRDSGRSDPKRRNHATATTSFNRSVAIRVGLTACSPQGRIPTWSRVFGIVRNS